MEQAPAFNQPWDLLIDPAAAQAAIERIGRLDLHRRICRPLDRRCRPPVSVELSRYDDAVEAEAASGENLIET